jgi:hypothetical protein
MREGRSSITIDLKRIPDHIVEREEPMRYPLASSLVLALTAGVISTGCGGSNTTTPQAQPTTGASAPKGKQLEIKMGDYFYDP